MSRKHITNHGEFEKHYCTFIILDSLCLSFSNGFGHLKGFPCLYAQVHPVPYIVLFQLVIYWYLDLEYSVVIFSANCDILNTQRLQS